MHGSGALAEILTPVAAVTEHKLSEARAACLEQVRDYADGVSASVERYEFACALLEVLK
jgi:hypothetical protein